MNTEEFIDLLSRDDTRPRAIPLAKRFGVALLLGLVLASVLAAATLGIRNDWALAVHLPMFWWKLAYAVALGCASLLATVRLALPGRRVGLGWVGMLLPCVLVLLAAGVVLAQAPRAQWGELVRGETWLWCPWLIALLSAPAFVLILRAIRALAPTRLRVAGASGGLLAGSLATMAYCVHCPEMQLPFWGTWYTLGILLPGLAGALLGPRLLRW